MIDSLHDFAPGNVGSANQKRQSPFRLFSSRLGLRRLLREILDLENTYASMAASSRC
jgi:hypothetical protein